MKKIFVIVSAAAMLLSSCGPDPKALCKQALDAYDAEDYATAFALGTTAADLNEAEAQEMVARCYLFGRSVAKDTAKALDYFGKAAAQNNGDAYFWLGSLYFSGSNAVPMDGKKAFESFQKSVELGCMDSYYYLARCYEDGVGTSPDFDKALENYLKGAEDDDELSQYEAARILVHKERYSDAVVLARKSAEAGYDEGQALYAQCLEFGMGCEKDLDAAFEWYTKAADQDNDMAQYFLALMYVNREDYAKAEELLEKSANQGNQLAMEMLSAKN